LISASIFRITFDFPFSTWLIFSIQCQGLVDFLWKMVACMKILWISSQLFLVWSNYILKQILFISCLLRIQIQVDLPLIFQAVNDDSIALTVGKSDVDLLDTENTHATTNMCSCSS
jgi:hypothetical protein